MGRIKLLKKSKEAANFFMENKLIAFLFLFATVFFIYQHSLGISWDFASYSLNAEYIFFGGDYFEWYRAPLASFLIGVFTFFVLPLKVGEYLYIIFTSSVFLYSCIKFSESFHFDKTLFYALMLNPFVVLIGLAVGTELLTLSFLLLFFSYLFSGTKVKSGASFALAALARYSTLPYSILIFFTKNLNKKHLFLFFAVIILFFLPWFLFNYFHTGNFLTSIADSQALNVKYRMDYLFQMPSLLDFAMAGNLLIPFFILGIRKTKFGRKEFAMISFLLLTILFYIYTPVKVERYLFNIILPLAYFSYFYLKDIKRAEIAFSAITIFSIMGLIVLSTMVSVGYLSLPKEEFYDLGEQNCMWASNQWVPLNYLGYHIKEMPREEEFSYYLDEGYRLVIFYRGYPSNRSSLKKYPVIREHLEYIVLGNPDKCKEIHKVDTTYLYNLNRTIFRIHNESIETDPCRSIGFGTICDYFKFL